MPTDIEKLAADVKALTPANQLRLAAGLIEKGQHDTAEAVMKMVMDQLTLARLFRKR